VKAPFYGTHQFCHYPQGIKYESCPSDSDSDSDSKRDDGAINSISFGEMNIENLGGIKLCLYRDENNVTYHDLI
jgi:hypothetical protein